MKKNYLKVAGFFLFCLFICSSCVKIIDHKDKCRLAGITSDFGDQSYIYNQMGLLDRYNISGYLGYFKMEYDASGRLVKSRLYLDSADVLQNTIVFFYQNDHIVKETWYDKNTQTKTDEIFYTYNDNGLVSKAQSSVQGYTIINKYTPDGANLEEDAVYFGGILAYKSYYTFLLPHHKSPLSAVPGLKYDFAYYGGFSQDKWYSTSEKDFSYDANGKNPQLVNYQDPTKSIIQFNAHNYITETDFFDTLTKTYVHFKFDYENCGLDNGGNANSTQKLPTTNTRKISPSQFLKVGSKSLKEQLKELREQYLK